jgi:hypothetical protein
VTAAAFTAAKKTIGLFNMYMYTIDGLIGRERIERESLSAALSNAALVPLRLRRGVSFIRSICLGFRTDRVTAEIGKPSCATSFP